MVDIVLVTLPKMEIRAPLIGPAALKSICEKNGYTVKCIDFNIDLYSRLRTKVPNWWINNDFTFMDDTLFENAWKDYLEPTMHEWCLQIKQLNPTFIGITVLSTWTERICNKFIQYATTYCPNSKIVLGGPGTQPVYGSEKLKEGNIDAYITGEGELSFLEYIKGNKNYPGINNITAQQITNMNVLPFPDYSDFDLSKYSSTWWQPEKEPTGCSWLYITGTRGCIKKCTFCNVGSIWPMFVGKSGNTIAEEIKYYVDTTNISKYYFTDSLLNGNVEQLEQMADTIIENKLKIKIKGQWIARGEKVMSKSLWKKLKQAGLNQIIIGIESGSAKVRNDMKKGVREEDILYTFQQASLHGIKCIPLLMVGYPTETDEDFEDNLLFWKRYKKFNDDGTIMMPYLGTTTRVLPNTPLDDKFGKMGMWYDELGHWVYKDNTMKKRIERWFRMRDEAIANGYELTLDTPGILIREYKEITGIDLSETYKLRKGEQIWND